MNILDISMYNDDIKNVNIQWDKLSGKSIAISGATGLIGRFMIDSIMYRNNHDNLKCKVHILVRNLKNAKEQFVDYIKDINFHIVEYDVSLPLKLEEQVDYLIHLASNTHPLSYANEPIETIMANVWGSYYMLEYAAKYHSKFVLASSVEIYGENKNDVEKFDEDYLGYINCNTLRAGYPESKRVSEALCQAYIRQKDVNSVIVRLSRVYGPTMKLNDSKAMSQFIKNAIQGEDIVLKSEGNQLYSYCYVADAVSAILTCMLEGQNGGAYNIADEKSNVTLKYLAETLASLADTSVIYKLPSENEKAGYSTATKALLDNSKITALGWTCNNTIENGLRKTIKILKSLYP